MDVTKSLEPTKESPPSRPPSDEPAAADEQVRILREGFDRVLAELQALRREFRQHVAAGRLGRAA